MAKPLPDPELDWPIPLDGVYEIASSEGLSLTAYRCPAGVPTIGWGETTGVEMGDTCTKEQADMWLLGSLTRRSRAVRKMCVRPPSQHELAAMLSLAYNVGLEGLRNSTVLRAHNAGDRQGAANAFGLWNKYRDPNTGQLVVSDGLSARRAREKAMYLTPDEEGVAESMPQAVAVESSLTKSPISQGGAVTAAAGALTGAASITDKLGDASGFLGSVKGLATQVVDFIGVPPGVMLAVVLIAAGVAVMKWRKKQRDGGWA